jgi:hypothetical protein
MTMRKLLMLPLLFAFTTGGMLHASAEKNQPDGSTEQVRIKECWFTGQTNNNVTFSCVLTNTTEHPVEVAVGASAHTFVISTLAGKWLVNMGMLAESFGCSRFKKHPPQPPLIIPAYESRVHEIAMGAFRFDRPHQGDVRVRVDISPCPYSFPTNSSSGVILFKKDLKFDEIMEARQVGDILIVSPK